MNDQYSIPKNSEQGILAPSLVGRAGVGLFYSLPCGEGWGGALLLPPFVGRAGVGLFLIAD
jgi:hypothetical protein